MDAHPPAAKGLFILPKRPTFTLIHVNLPTPIEPASVALKSRRNDSQPRLATNGPPLAQVIVPPRYFRLTPLRHILTPFSAQHSALTELTWETRCGSRETRPNQFRKRVMERHAHSVTGIPISSSSTMRVHPMTRASSFVAIDAVAQRTWKANSRASYGSNSKPLEADSSAQPSRRL